MSAGVLETIGLTQRLMIELVLLSRSMCAILVKACVSSKLLL